MTNEEILAQPNHPERRALMALNILREAAGLEPLPDDTDDRPVPDLPRHQ
jgi:hypothetical protein